MAGDNVYLGNILGQLKQDTKDYTTTLESVINKLDNLRIAIAQCVTEVNCRASSNLKAALNNPANAATLGSDGSKWYCQYSFVASASGTIRVDFTHSKSGSGSPIGNTQIRTSRGFIGNGSILYINGLSSLVVPVGAGDIVDIGCYGQGGNCVLTLAANSVRVYYDVVDIVNDGAIAGI